MFASIDWLCAFQPSWPLVKRKTLLLCRASNTIASGCRISDGSSLPVTRCQRPSAKLRLFPMPGTPNMATRSMPLLMSLKEACQAWRVVLRVNNLGPLWP